jgi:hypothetical protein
MTVSCGGPPARVSAGGGRARLETVCFSSKNPARPKPSRHARRKDYGSGAQQREEKRCGAFYTDEKQIGFPGPVAVFLRRPRKHGSMNKDVDIGIVRLAAKCWEQTLCAALGAGVRLPQTVIPGEILPLNSAATIGDLSAAGEESGAHHRPIEVGKRSQKVLDNDI